MIADENYFASLKSLISSIPVRQVIVKTANIAVSDSSRSCLQVLQQRSELL